MDLLDLKDDEQLRNACISLQEQVISLAGNQSWITKFQDWLVRVRDVSHEEFLSKDFQLLRVRCSLQTPGLKMRPRPSLPGTISTFCLSSPQSYSASKR